MRILTLSTLLLLIPALAATETRPRLARHEEQTFGNRLLTTEIAHQQKAGNQAIPAKEAARAMTLPEGFKASLFAGEPDVVQPIAITFDDRGRLWVVECLSYPNWRKDGTGHDRVLILEDSNHTGTFDKRTVFLDNGSNLSGITIGFGGVWLCSTPNLIFIPLKEGEDKPAGPPQIVLDGWNLNEAKHNVFNSLNWGPDGWLYGCNGIQSKSWVGAPGAPREQRAYIDCGVWRYHPTRKVFEAFAHGTTNPFGLDWDDSGELFITNCVIDHLFHFAPGGHYQRMYGQDANPNVFSLMGSCVKHRHWAGGDWTTSRGTGPGGKPEHSDAGGGHAHCGCLIYLGDNFPAEYRNSVFMCNIHGNRLNRDRLTRTPSGYLGVREKDFLFANDSWFRGIALASGPDGGLYVTDWCDTGECHNYDRVDASNGRIFKVTYGTPKPWTGDIAKLSDSELVKLQLHPNDWFVRKARRVLQERASAGALEPGTAVALRKMLNEEKEVPKRLRALWALQCTAGLTDSEIIKLLNDKQEAVRVWAVRLSAEHREKTGEDLIAAIARLARRERSEFVLQTVAGGLRLLPRHSLATILEGLLANEQWIDPNNSNLADMVWYAVLEDLRDSSKSWKLYLSEHQYPFVRRNTARYLMSQEITLPAKRQMLERLLPIITALPDSCRKDVLGGIEDVLNGYREFPEPASWKELFAELSTSDSMEVRRSGESLGLRFNDRKVIDKLRSRALDTRASQESRVAAIELLAARKLPDFAKTLQGLLGDEVVRPAAIRALAAFADAETPAAILKAYPQFTPAEKIDAVQTLAVRAPWARALLEAIEKGSVPRADVPVTMARQILALKDKTLEAQLEKVWGKITPASKERAAQMKKWKEILTEETLARGDAAKGRAIFTKNCAACHKMYGEGNAVGPELTGSQRANLDYVLENVLDPSAVVPNEYRMINFLLNDDRVVSGIILRETREAITIRTTNDTVIVPMAEIASRNPTNLSIMPDGLFDQMKPDEVRDLVIYLRSKEQVPLAK